MFGAIAIHICNLLKGVFRAMSAEARYRRAERQLYALDARLLRDMGIEPAQIGAAVRPPAPRLPAAHPRPGMLPAGVWERS